MEKFLKIIRYLILGGIFLIPFIPLVVSSSLFFPFITGKNFFFRILTEIIFGLWLILAIYDKKYRPKFNRQNLVLIFASVFIFILILSTIFSVNPYRSFWSNYERMEGLVTFLHLFAFFLVLISVMNPPAGGEKLWKWFFNVLLDVSVIVGIYGLMQFGGVLETHQGNRLDATLGNSSYLAIYMVFHIFLALIYLFRTKEWYRWFYLPVIILETIVLYYTATRGAILGFIGGLLLAAVLMVLFAADRKIKIFSAVALGTVILLVAVFLIFKSSPFVSKSLVLSRFSNISFQETTTQSRLTIWKMSWEGFKERPVLGWGLENYNLIFNKYYQPILWKQEPWFDRAHNVFFDRLTTNGILGLLSYFGLFTCGIYCLWRKRDEIGFSVYDSIFITSMFAAYFVHNFFVFDNIVSLILFFIFIAYISSKINAHNKQDKIQNSIDASNLGLKSTYAMIVGITTIFVVYFINVPAILASNNLIKAFTFLQQGDGRNTLQEFQQSIDRNSLGTTEAREHLANFAAQVAKQPNIDANLKKEVVDYAASEMKKQIERFPGDIRYMTFLGVVDNAAGRYDEAAEILNEAIALSPNKQMLYFELCASYLNKKEYSKAVEISKKAFELNKSFDEARKIYVASLIYNGEFDEADHILMEGFGTTIVADDRILKAYAEKKEFAKIVTILEKLVEEQPNNFQYHLALAANYLQINERQRAIEQLQKVIELKPDFKQQGEYYINEIKAGRNP
ncbi:MAG: O-antigen ligase family protein [Candidatus Paceibacterota bacterium]